MFNLVWAVYKIVNSNGINFAYRKDKRVYPNKQPRIGYNKRKLCPASSLKRNIGCLFVIQYSVSHEPNFQKKPRILATC